jgi:hypothetical protein
MLVKDTTGYAVEAEMARKEAWKAKIINNAPKVEEERQKAVTARGKLEELTKREDVMEAEKSEDKDIAYNAKAIGLLLVKVKRAANGTYLVAWVMGGGEKIG